MRVIIVGSGVAGAEAATFLGLEAKSPIELIEIEAEPTRRFGGWGFQPFPGESTNLAMRKMFLGEDPEDIFRFAHSFQDEHPSFQFDANETFPRAIMQEYVRWRRSKVANPLTKYTQIVGEAMKVVLGEDITVLLKDGTEVQADRLVMASGSISVKIPPYLNPFLEDSRVIIDPLCKEGHEARTKIKPNDSVLVLGTGLTGEEQANVLLKSGRKRITLFSRGGLRHFPYPKQQSNIPLVLEEPPMFLHAETPEEFDSQMNEFFGHHLNNGHSPEDIFAAIRPFWDQMRKDLGGCLKAAERIRTFKRELAVNSIGVPWEVSENLRNAEAEGMVAVIHGDLNTISKRGEQFEVVFNEDRHHMFDWVINAVGRNIIRHPIWDQLLEDGIAKKHAGIGVMVSETGRLLDAEGVESDRIWVVGMARAGDHALRHGYLGNTAFNVPQVRSHLYKTMRDLLSA